MQVRTALLAAAAAALALPLLGLGLDAPTRAADAGGKKMSARQLARIELGRRLFFDPAASPSGARSCASCHAPDHGWSDPARVSADDVGDTRRHSQTLLDAAYHATAHWDGEFHSVEELVVTRLGTEPSRRSHEGGYGGHGRRTPHTPGARPVPVTPGERRELVEKVQIPGGTSRFVETRLLTDGRYGEGFHAAFGTKQVTLENIATAIAAFVHTIEHTEAPFDRFRAGDAKALSASAKRGLLLFEGRAKCASCHKTTGERPFFTDFAFHNTGVTKDELENADLDPKSRLALSIATLRKRMTNRRDRRMLETQILSLTDSGRAVHSGLETDKRAFKTPTLRDVAKRGPYMHSGRFNTLEEVVGYYAKGGGPDKKKSAHLEAFECSEQDAKDLVAFLHALSGDEQPGRATVAWTRRAPQTRVKFVDSQDRPLKKLAVRVQPAGHELPAKRADASPIELVTDSGGTVRFKPGTRTHMKIVLPEGLPLRGGGLVPDTCRQTTIRVPVAGRMTFEVSFPEGVVVPKTIVGHHSQANTLQGHEAPRTVFTLQGEPTVMKGALVASFEGWARVDAGTGVTLDFPRRVAKQAVNGRERGHVELTKRKFIFAVSGGALYRFDVRP